MEVNIYCDESCHLEDDGHSAMVLGAVWCPKEKALEIAKRIRGIKALHGLDPAFEAKWTKVSPGKIKFYLGLINYFFSESDLHFRGLVIPDKSLIDHSKFPGQDHDNWYYKMYYSMLTFLLSEDERYNIYIDTKDTCGAAKVRDLKVVLASSIYDFDAKIVQKVQLVDSRDIQQMQLADLLIGCLSFVSRGLNVPSSSPAKLEIVKRVQSLSGLDLTKTTLVRERKFNLFKWQAK